VSSILYVIAISLIGPADLLVTAGEYRELVPGKRLVMTWSCIEPLVSSQDATTLITVEMRGAGGREHGNDACAFGCGIWR
jgi:hypothetical protein